VKNTHNSDDLERTQPELELTKELDSTVVDSADDDEEDENPYTGIDLGCVFPLLNNQGGGSELIRRRDDVLEPVRPSQSKTESRVAEAGSVTGETRRVGDPGSHFTERSHDNVDEETNGGVGNEDGAGAAGG
jgi:hypothetical protein